MIRKNVDLEKSFEKLKSQMKRANEHYQRGYPPAAYNLLEHACEILLEECTQPDTQDDLPSEFSAAPQKGNVSDNSLLHY